MGNIAADSRSVNNIVYDWLTENKPKEKFSAVDIQREYLPAEKMQTIRSALHFLEKVGVVEAVAKLKINGFRTAMIHYKYLGPNAGLKFHNRPERTAHYKRNVVRAYKKRTFEDFDKKRPVYYNRNGNSKKQRSVNLSTQQFLPAPFHERLFALAVEAEGLLQSYSDAALLMEVRRRGLHIGENNDN